MRITSETGHWPPRKAVWSDAIPGCVWYVAMRHGSGCLVVDMRLRVVVDSVPAWQAALLAYALNEPNGCRGMA